MSLFAPPQLIQTEAFTEVLQAMRKSSTDAERIAAGRGEPLYRVQSCRGEMTTNIAYGGPDRKTLCIRESTTCTILMARVPTAGRVL